MKEITRTAQSNFDGVCVDTVKIGGLVCNKKAPALKSAKIGGLVCNKQAPMVKSK